jgi:hypothetical protein
LKSKSDHRESPRTRRLLAMSMSGIATVFVALTIWTAMRSSAKHGRVELSAALVGLTLAFVIAACFVVREWWKRRD